MQVNHVRSKTFLRMTICVQIGREMLPYTGRTDLRGPRALFLLTVYLVSSGGRRLALVRVIGFWAGASGTAAQAGVGSGPQVPILAPPAAPPPLTRLSACSVPSLIRLPFIHTRLRPVCGGAHVLSPTGLALANTSGRKAITWQVRQC